MRQGDAKNLIATRLEFHFREWGNALIHIISQDEKNLKSARVVLNNARFILVKTQLLLPHINEGSLKLREKYSDAVINAFKENLNWVNGAVFIEKIYNKLVVYNNEPLDERGVLDQDSQKNLARLRNLFRLKNILSLLKSSGNIDSNTLLPCYTGSQEEQKKDLKQGLQLLGLMGYTINLYEAIKIKRRINLALPDVKKENSTKNQLYALKVLIEFVFKEFPFASYPAFEQFNSIISYIKKPVPSPNIDFFIAPDWLSQEKNLTTLIKFIPGKSRFVYIACHCGNKVDRYSLYFLDREDINNNTRKVILASNFELIKRSCRFNRSINFSPNISWRTHTEILRISGMDSPKFYQDFLLSCDANIPLSSFLFVISQFINNVEIQPEKLADFLSEMLAEIVIEKLLLSMFIKHIYIFKDIFLYYEKYQIIQESPQEKNTLSFFSNDTDGFLNILAIAIVKNLDIDVDQAGEEQWMQMPTLTNAFQTPLIEKRHLTEEKKILAGNKNAPTFFGGNIPLCRNNDCLQQHATQLKRLYNIRIQGQFSTLYLEKIYQRLQEAVELIGVEKYAGFPALSLAEIKQLLEKLKEDISENTPLEMREDILLLLNSFSNLSNQQTLTPQSCAIFAS